MEKRYTLPVAIAMVVGTVIGSGIFFKAEAVLKGTGGNLGIGILAFIIMGIVMIISACTFGIVAQSHEGVDGLVGGGQTMNPSTEAILQEVNRTPSEIVFILPNNKNIIMAAQQLLGRTCGVFGEPAGVTGAAGVKKLCEQGVLGANDTVVSVVTGNGLKDVANAIKFCGEPMSLPNDLDLLVEEFAKRGIKTK